MKKNLLTAYYLLLLLVIGYKVADTVYKGSVTISFAQTLDERRQAKEDLQASVTNLTDQLASQTTVTTVLASETSQEFQPISQTITIESSQALAQR